MNEAARRIVLIADDDPETLELLRAMVESRGYESLTAVNGREAVQKVVEVQPDMVLLDVMMPQVDGYTVCRHIKNNDLLSRIKVILYSAKEKEKGRETAKGVGADAYLPKPFDPAELIRIMEELFAEQDRETPHLVRRLAR